MHEPDFGHLAEFIRNYRNAHGLSLAQLAEKAGVSRSMIFQIEGGKTVPTLNVVSKLAFAMGTPISSLIDPYQNNQNFYCRKAKDRPHLEAGGITFVPFSAETPNRKIEVLEFQLKQKGRFELPLYPWDHRIYSGSKRGSYFPGARRQIGNETRRRCGNSRVDKALLGPRGILNGKRSTGPLFWLRQLEAIWKRGEPRSSNEKRSEKQSQALARPWTPLDAECSARFSEAPQAPRP